MTLETNRTAGPKTGRAFSLAGVLLSLVLAAGCAGGQMPASTPEAVQKSQASSSPTLPAQTPTPRVSQVASNLPTGTATPRIEPENQSAPIYETPDFSSSGGGEQSVKVWRPPVYPVPWMPSPQDHFYFKNPIAAHAIEDAYSNYGYGDVFFDKVVHTGIDIPGEIGTPILAAGDGKVIYAGYGVYRGGRDVFDDPYGKAVVIEHDFSYQGQPLYTLYAHLDEITITEGANVSVGDQLGLMGNTGKTTGPHLHFEVRVGSNDYFSTRNPDLWIAPPQGWGVLVGQVLTWEGWPLELQEVTLFALDDPAPEDHKLWVAKSYQNEAINSDPYYKENVTISNLPAGKYLLNIPVISIGKNYDQVIEIKPGQVTFFRLNLWRGITRDLPPTPTVQFNPVP